MSVTISPRTEKPLSPRTLAQQLGITSRDNELSRTGIADLLRTAVARWGVCRRRDLTTYVSRLLLAAELDSEQTHQLVKDVIAELVLLREVEEIRVDGQPFLAPALPRLVRLSTDVGFLAGCIPGAELESLLTAGQAAPRAPLTQRLPDAASTASLVRWVLGKEALTGVPLPTWSLEDWLGEPGYLRHLQRRGLDEVAPLPVLWTHLEESFQASAGPIGDSARVLVIGGQPGEFFGSPLAEQRGRWRPADRAQDGLWCGSFRRGFHEGNLAPALVEVRDGQPVRFMELFDLDELYWALLARGAERQQPELIHARETDVLKQTCRLPRQISTVLRALCTADGWTWRTWPQARGAVADALQAGGLAIVSATALSDR